MVHIVLIVVGVLVVTAIAGTFVVLVVGDLRRSNGEPLSSDARRSLEAHEQRDAQRRVNKGARYGTW